MYRIGALLVLAATVALAGCETTPGVDGALLGGALGAGLGAVAGHQSGHQGEGALIGAGAGALAGGIIGHEIGQAQRRQYAAPQAPPVLSATPGAPRGGHYDYKVVESPNGERYEQRVWVPHR